MNTAERARIIALWKGRLDRDILLVGDIVETGCGSKLTKEMERMLRHQLERLVADVAEEKRDGEVK